MRSILLIFIILSTGLYGQEVELDTKTRITVNSTGNDREMLVLFNDNIDPTAFASMFIGTGDGLAAGSGTLTAYPGNWFETNYRGGFRIASQNKSLIFNAQASDGKIRFLTGGTSVPSNQRMVIDDIGNVGIGTRTPQTLLHVSGGDLYVEKEGSILILKDAAGGCHAISVNSVNVINSVTIPCP